MKESLLTRLSRNNPWAILRKRAQRPKEEKPHLRGVDAGTFARTSGTEKRPGIFRRWLRHGV